MLANCLSAACSCQNGLFLKVQIRLDWFSNLALAGISVVLRKDVFEKINNGGFWIPMSQGSEVSDRTYFLLGS